MPQKNKKQSSDNKKNAAQETVSQQEQLQVQQQLEQYRSLAQKLYQSTNQAEAEANLLPITGMSEAAQLTLLKALSKEKSVDAANVLLTVKELAPLKEVRKEARRGLIRLENTRTYPQWTPPIAQPSILEALTLPATPSRFWKGVYTDTRETGEMQLILCFEQGTNYQEARIMGFLLDFWHDGVKDFFTNVGSKRRMEEHITNMRARSMGLPLADCTLAEGKRLLQEALDANKRARTRPSPDYSRNLPLIRQLILDAPDTDEASTVDEEDIEDIDADRDIEETIETFLEVWSARDYEAAYDLLASDSPLRAGLSRDEWIASRNEWAEQAKPANVQIDIGYGLEPDEENAEVSLNELDAFWSLELVDTPLTSTIQELPMGTIVYKDTGRHWFWATYTCVQEEDEQNQQGQWLIQSMSDKGAAAQQLSVSELEQRIQAIRDEVQELAEEFGMEADLGEEYEEEDEENKENKENDVEDTEEEEEEDEEDEDDIFLDDLDLEEEIEEISWFTKQAMHYNDAIIAQSPQDYDAYELASSQAAAIEDWERAAAYLELIAERFPEQRGNALRRLATVLIASGIEDEELEEDEERGNSFVNRLESILRDSIDADNQPLSYLLLAELYIERDTQLDEAEQLLQQALTLTQNPRENALIEVGLAKAAQKRDDNEAALNHYQRAAELSPDLPDIWNNIGAAQLQLGQVDAAEQSYLHSIEVTPDEPNAYAALSSLYIEQKQDLSKAQEILEQGVAANPDISDLMAALAMSYVTTGNIRRAEELLQEAEEVDPDTEMVQMTRYILEASKAEQKAANRPAKPHKHKKKR